ncbi:hypothetical protein ACJ4V0_19285 [Phreatobacter sp. HK31-P]
MSQPRSLRLGLIAATLLLGGCLSTPIRSIPRLLRLDFATLKMDEVRAGLRLPDMLRVRPGDATMTVRTRGPQGATEDVFVLAEDADAGERSRLTAEARPGFALSLWRIAPDDLPRVAAIQERVRASEGQAGRIRGGIEIKVSGGCRTARIPAGPVLMSSFLRPSRGETYITLVDGLDLRQYISVADWQAKIPACGA